mmetsp:Transcript_25165/g.52874  ORF Transcript_25165/g.52874 Transcript_25165/m.52874 type:complete len:360 (-) Transcript_25165:1587-2666(-)
MNTKTNRSTRKKTDIKIPEPRHRVGPKGISSGISFRNLPPPSLDQIKNICEHYQEKCAGTYKSLASRYVYQMATEIEGLVEALKKDSYVSDESFPSTEDYRCDSNYDDYYYENYKKHPGIQTNNRHRPRSNGRHFNDKDCCQFIHSSSNPSALGQDEWDCKRQSNRESRQRSSKRNKRIFARGSCVNELDSRENPTVVENLEEQNKEVLRWLKEEMERSQQLLKRSKLIHEAELDDAKVELQKVKKAAKMIIKAIYKKGKDKAARSEAQAIAERKRRKRSQQDIEDLIESHSAQIDLLKKGLHKSRRYESKCKPEVLCEEYADSREICSLVNDIDLTSVFDEFAEESYHQSCCSAQSRF